MNQEEHFGVGRINDLSDILPKLNPKNIFLVHGNKSFRSSGAEEILNQLLKNYSVTHFNEFAGYPKIEDIKKGMDRYAETEIDVMIAVGGGTAIDIAKSINILSAQEENPKTVLPDEVKIKNNGKPFIAIPTTSGSGSEATHFAVVYAGREKYSLAHEFILPDYALIDPQLTYSLPSHITATSGTDAFSQAVESYWNINANDESKKYSAEAIKLILSNLKTAVNNPDNESRFNMSKAAHLAGKAINISKTTAPHAVSYSLTSYFGISHGQAVSITLPEFIEYNYKVTEEDKNGRGNTNEVRSNIEELIKLLGCRDINESKIMIKNLLRSIGLKTKLSELNIKPDDLKIITDNVNTERLKNNPRQITPASLEKILRNIL